MNILYCNSNLQHNHSFPSAFPSPTCSILPIPSLSPSSPTSYFSKNPSPLLLFIAPAAVARPPHMGAYKALTNQQLLTIFVQIAMSAEKQSYQHEHSQESENSSQLPLPPTQKKQASSPNPPEVEFQKNYPKNIFIPLIEYLTEVGYKEAYEKCVGCRGEFEGKNVVSLSSIYTLITQDWFCRNINKEGALAHISNKILINSKIKKKLFHLLIANMVLMAHYTDLRDFKRRVSKEANLIARRPLPQDDLFSHPNAIIYLLSLFLKILLLHASKKGYLKLEEELEKLSLEDTPAAEAKSKNVGSKEEYKFYVKEIVHVLNGKGLQVHSLTDILEQTKQSILEKDKGLREKYQLIEGIPNWIYFIEIVAVRCFESKRKDMKITNFIFNEWINECKIQMLSVFNKTPENKETAVQGENYWETGTIEWKHSKFNFSAQTWTAEPQLPVEKGKADQEEGSVPITAGKSKEFTPIILSKMKLK